MLGFRVLPDTKDKRGIRIILLLIVLFFLSSEIYLHIKLKNGSPFRYVLSIPHVTRKTIAELTQAAKSSELPRKKSRFISQPQTGLVPFIPRFLDLSSEKAKKFLTLSFTLTKLTEKKILQGNVTATDEASGSFVSFPKKQWIEILRLFIKAIDLNKNGYLELEAEILRLARKYPGGNSLAATLLFMEKDGVPGLSDLEISAALNADHILQALLESVSLIYAILEEAEQRHITSQGTDIEALMLQAKLTSDSNFQLQLKSIIQKIESNLELTKDDVRMLIRYSFQKEFDKVMGALSEEDIQVLAWMQKFDPSSYIVDKHFNFSLFRNKVLLLTELQEPHRSINYSYWEKRTKRDGNRLKPGEIYLNGEKINLRMDTVLDHQKELIEFYRPYLDTLIPIILSEPGSFILNPIYALNNTDLGVATWGFAEVIDSKGEKLFLPRTTGHIAKLPFVFAAVAKALHAHSVINYGGLHPNFRRESEEVEGWRKNIFPQIHIETVTASNQKEDQQCVDIQSISKLIESLKALGMPEESIRIRINDHAGVIGLLLKINGLNYDQIIELGDLFDEVASFQAKRDFLAMEKTKSALLAKIEAYDFVPFVFEFLKMIIEKDKYNQDILTTDENTYPVIRNIERLKRTTTLLAALYPKVNITLDTRSFRTITYKNIGFQADIDLGGDKYYPEIAGGGGNFSARRDLYLTGFALGIMRIDTILRQNPTLRPHPFKLTSFRTIQLLFNKNHFTHTKTIYYSA